MTEQEKLRRYFNENFQDCCIGCGDQGQILKADVNRDLDTTKLAHGFCEFCGPEDQLTGEDKMLLESVKGRRFMVMGGFKMIGSAGTATKMNIEGQLKGEQLANLAAWLLYLPRQHPLWWHYQLSLCHLRDLPGCEPAQKSFPEAAYELALWALNPSITPDPNDIDSIHIMLGPNYVFQFNSMMDDEKAKLLAARVATAFADGTLLAEPEGIIGARDFFVDFCAEQIQDLIAPKLT